MVAPGAGGVVAPGIGVKFLSSQGVSVTLHSRSC